MSSSYVWVQLYYNGKVEPEGNPIVIETASLDPAVIAALTEAVKVKMAEELMHCSPARLDVYPPKSSGDRQKQYGPDKEMKEVIAELEKKKTPPTSGKYPLIVVAPTPPLKSANENIVAFLVGGTVRGAKQSSGARGNVFKYLQKYAGLFSKSEGIQVFYSGNDLLFKAYFYTRDAACGFQNALYEWEIHKDLAHLDGVSLDPPTPLLVDAKEDFERIYLQHYIPTNSELPCATLDQLHSYRLSVPVTEAVEPTTDLARFQCIDKIIPHIQHYKCHLKDKAKFKQLHTNENNMVAASWLFHQQLDGLNVSEGIPLVALSWESASPSQLASHGSRYQVTLLAEFFYPELAAVFAHTDQAAKVDDRSWRINVYVQDKNLFKECIDWKSADTKSQWESHRAFLEYE